MSETRTPRPKRMIFNDISFIVIARNESLAVGRCLDSIVSMPLEDCEVICVDSDSTDSTMEVMKAYRARIQNLIIIQCSGNLNAAIARNAGTKYITKQYVFFVDGDVELCPDFLQDSLQRMQADEIDAATGNLDEIVYSEGYEQIIKPKSHRRYYTKAREISHSGGTFIARRQLVEEIGEWNTRMVINEDYDYALRIARRGRMMALPTTMGIHHTLADHERSWPSFRKGYPMIFGMLIRKNWDRPDLLKGIMHNYRVGFAWWGLLFLATLSALLLGVSPWPVFAVFGLLVVLDIVWGVIRKTKLNSLLFTHYLDIPLIVLGVFVDLRRKKTPTEIKRIA